MAQTSLYFQCWIQKWHFSHSLKSTATSRIVLGNYGIHVNISEFTVSFSVSYLPMLCVKRSMSDTPLQSRHPWIYLIGNSNKLCEHRFQCILINNYDTDRSIFKNALSKYDHHFAIKLTFDCLSGGEKVQIAILTHCQTIKLPL